MALILVLAMTAACGDDSDDDDDDGGTAPTATTATGAATEPAGGGDATEPADGGDATEPADGGDSGEGDAAAGEEIAQAQCFTCHTTDGSTLVGPTWQGLYGSEVTLEDGSTVTADDEYIRESILEPNAKIHEGFPAAMPSFDGVLSDEQITDIIAYIKTLE
jgi:mono/diheme cytochrome c family protein